MKREIARYVSEYVTCQKVKADYMKPRGLLQPLSILDWKWDDISMYFIVGLSLTTHKFDSIWVIMEQLTKFAYLSAPSIKSRSMLRSTLLMCNACTEFRSRSSLIEGHSLSLTFGSNCTHLLGLTRFTVRPIFRRRMAKLSK
jgi:hypothetical protein